MNNCLFCNQETSNPKFCSTSCAAKHNNKIKPKRQPEGQCKLCQVPIKSGRTYCKTCWSNHENNIKGSHRHLQQQHCLNCNTPIDGYRAKFCNNQKCFYDYHFQDRIKLVEERGYIYEDTKYDTSASFAKRYLRHKFGDQCSICHISADNWNGKPIILIMDHINGISNDWSITNLRLVCPNCDSQLPTFKSKNRGKGRPYRPTLNSGQRES